jgi:hypothetical protein
VGRSSDPAFDQLVPVPGVLQVGQQQMIDTVSAATFGPETAAA